MKMLCILLFGLVSVLGISVVSDAALIDRGGGMIYDSILNVTWLQDANYAQTSGHDTDGLMTWDQANDWAANLVYGGFSDWRLPTFDENNPSNSGPLSLDHEMEYLRRGEGITPENPGPFINMSHFAPDGHWLETWYWTGTLNSHDLTRAWRFDLGCG